MERGRLSRWRYSLYLGAICLLAIALVWGHGSAQASVESRLSRLESAMSYVRSHVRQLDSEVRRLSQAVRNQETVIPPRREDLVTSPPPSTISEDPLFERLATLAVELKERLDSLEARVEELESRQ